VNNQLMERVGGDSESVILLKATGSTEVLYSSLIVSLHT
jgi:hypothetical protein